MSAEEHGFQGVAARPGASIRALFAKSAIEHGDRLAVVCGGRQISYRDLERRATRIALCLRAAGVSKGELVGLAAHRSIESVAAMLGILEAGAAYLPFDVSYPPNLLRYIYAASRPALTLVQRALMDDAGIEQFWTGAALYLDPDCGLSGSRGDDESAATPCGQGGSLSPASGIIAPLEGAEDLAYVMFTSGSTGRPKGVMIPHRGIIRLVCGCEFAALGPDETILHLAPLSFDASTFEIWGALLNGGRLAVAPAPHPSLDEIAEAIRDYQVTTLWLTAGLFHLMVERRLDGLKPLRQLIVGGDVLSPPHIEKALTALPGCRIVNGYGPTENTTFTCCYAIPRDRPCLGSIPIGSAIRGTVVHVLDEEMRPVPEGVEGELYAGGAGLATGYLNRPELTAEKFVNDPFDPNPEARLYRTGDRVRRRPDGNLEFLGRVDRQVKINGKRVELDEIEACLRRAEGVRDAAVVSRVDDAGRRSVAGFVTRADGRDPDPVRLRGFLRSELPDFMIPAEIRVLDVLPLSPTGKVDRTQLAKSDAQAAPDTASRRPPGSRTEAVLQQIWSRILGRDIIGTHSNFFDLGGTSLQLIEAHAEIADAFAGPISLVDLFEHPNVRELAAKIDGSGSAGQPLFVADDRVQRRSAALGRARLAAERRGSA